MACERSCDPITIYSFGETGWVVRFLGLFSNSLYLVMHESDCHDKTRTIDLHTVFVMNIFSSRVPRTQMLTYSCPPSNVHERNSLQDIPKSRDASGADHAQYYQFASVVTFLKSVYLGTFHRQFFFVPFGSLCRIRLSCDTGVGFQ